MGKPPDLLSDDKLAYRLNWLKSRRGYVTVPVEELENVYREIADVRDLLIFCKLDHRAWCKVINDGETCNCGADQVKHMYHDRSQWDWDKEEL